ncbi:MAG: hypothetical protein KBF88_16915 [Polyangiaceae bacterium]|nr:hypothetical protein [Polyangiaceae bacterium]
MRTSIHRTRIFGVTWSLLAAGALGCALEPEGEDLSTESASALTMSLTSGQTVTGLAASGASSNDFTIAIPPGTSGVSMSYTGTGYCTLRFNENAPPSAYAYTAINPLGIACNSSGTFWNVKSGTLYLSLVPLSHTYPNVDGYTNGSLTVTLLTTPLPSVTSFSIPSQLNGGIRFDALVKLSGPAPFPFAVSIADNHAAAASYFNIEFNAGESSKAISIFTDPVTSNVAGSFSASSGSSLVTTPFTVVPSGAGGGGTSPVTKQKLTVTATGRSGYTVTSSPTGISVRVGSTGSYDFATGTSVRLAVSGGKSAIWSGGCSSNGARRTSCTTTMNAARSVTANVQ